MARVEIVKEDDLYTIHYSDTKTGEYFGMEGLEEEKLGELLHGFSAYEGYMNDNFTVSYDLTLGEKPWTLSNKDIDVALTDLDVDDLVLALDNYLYEESNR